MCNYEVYYSKKTTVIAFHWLLLVVFQYNTYKLYQLFTVQIEIAIHIGLIFLITDVHIFAKVYFQMYFIQAI